MEKSSLSIFYDYLANKENLLKNSPLKRSLYRYRLLLQNKPRLYLLLKILFGLVFFAIPLSMLLILVTKTFNTEFLIKNFVIGILTVLISLCILIIYCFFFLTWRLYTIIKSK